MSSKAEFDLHGVCKYDLRRIFYLCIKSIYKVSRSQCCCFGSGTHFFVSLLHFLGFLGFSEQMLFFFCLRKWVWENCSKLGSFPLCLKAFSVVSEFKPRHPSWSTHLLNFAWHEICYSKLMRKSEINPVILEMKEIKSSQTTSNIAGNNQCQDDVSYGTNL